MTKVLCRDPHNAYMGFEYAPGYGQSSHFTGRHHPNAVDLYKEYKDSIYVSRYYNASFVCQIPIFTLTLPQRGRTGQIRPGGSGYNLGFPAIQAFFVLAGIALFSPIIFPEERRRSFRTTLNFESINQFLENQMNLISSSAIGRSMRTEERRSMFHFLGQNFNAVFESVLISIDQWLEYLPYFAKNKLKNCFQWSVCQLYNKPKKYGLIGLLFRAVFPYKHDSDLKSSDVMTSYRLAAVYGRKRSNDCKQRFNGCFVNKWDIIREIIYFLLNSSEHKITKTQKNMILYVMEKVLTYLHN